MVWDSGSDYVRQTTLRLEQELRDRDLQRRASWAYPTRSGRPSARRQRRSDARQVTRPAVLPIPHKAL